MLEPVRNEVDLDQIFVEIGELGRFQVKNYVQLSVVVLFAASVYLNYIFTSGQLNYRQEALC